MLAAREAVPTEEEQTNKSRFQEEGHQAFNGEWRAKNVTHIVGVVGPIRAELKFHREACGHTDGEVDAKKLAPEPGHVLVHLLAAYDVSEFHHDKHEGQAKRERHEDEMVHRGQRKLQA